MIWVFNLDSEFWATEKKEEKNFYLLYDYQNLIYINKGRLEGNGEQKIPHKIG